MQVKNLTTALITASTLVYGNAAEATEYGTSSSVREIENNVVYYGFNRIHPKGNQMQVVDKHIDELRSNPNTFIRVTSHTDHIGKWEINLSVSRKRALAIAEYLRMNGVPQDQIILDWLGESDPLYFSEHEKYKNRRSHISIIKKVMVKTPESAPLPMVNTVSPENNPTIQTAVLPTVPTAVSPEGNASVEETKVRLERLAYAATPTVGQTSVQDIKLPAGFMPVSTPLATESEAAAEVEVEVEVDVDVDVPAANAITKKIVQEGNFEFQKNILFVDSITLEPVMVDVDLKTKKGKEFFTSTEAGTLNIDYSESKTREMDIFAYGYFYTSVKINPGPFQQIIKLKPTVKGEKLAINNIEFVSGKSILMSKSRKELEKIYISIMMNSEAKIEIGGHVNAPGKAKNLNPKKFKISVDRAKTIYNYLIKKGVSKDNISYKGYGNSEMIHSKPRNEAEAARNRRVEIKILQ